MTKARRSRILLVTRNLPPLVGGMERLNWHMAEGLAKRAEVRVIGPRGAAALAPDGVVLREAPLVPLWKFLWHARGIARREARIWKPDIVLAGSGLTAPIARSAAATCRARTVVYVHGLDIAVRHPVYRAIWLEAIRGMDHVIANSHPTSDLCRKIGVPSDRIGMVHPGVDLPDLAGLKGADYRFRKEHGLGDRRLLLSVGRLSARKGLREFVSGALPQIVAACPDVMLLIVGDTPRQALRAEAQHPASIQEAAEAAGVGEHVRFLGPIPDDALAGAYLAADVHVFPVREIPGDPEGFGMVATEAAAHGLPTVAFGTGGVVDAVGEGMSGVLVAPGDYVALANATINQLNQGNVTREKCREHATGFGWARFNEQLGFFLKLSLQAEQAN
jgi:phosphatidylinositol alpha-1,6-mannosyltransferase